jgi:hypothetical protein
MSDITQCPTCERSISPEETAAAKAVLAKLGTVIPEDVIDDVIEDEESTDLEKYEDQIEALEAQEGFNLWRLKQIADMKAFAKTGFNNDGSAKDLLPAVEVVTHQFSPEEATNLEGWMEVTAGEFGNKLPRKYSKQADKLKLNLKHETFWLSKARSNGCFVIRNQTETSDYFLNNTAEAAEKTGGSPRILKMMGYATANMKFMFPTFDMYGASKKRVTGKEGVGHYCIDPEVPFNEWEIDTYKKMFVAYHFGGGALVGASWQTHSVIADMTVDRKEREPVAINSRHRMITLTNHPWFIMPLAMMQWNTTQFKDRLYRNLCFRAHSMDRNTMTPTPGYVSRKELGGSHGRDWEESVGESTSARTKTRPIFTRGSELELDGTPKDYGRK